MQTFALVDGDLVVAARGHKMISGPARVAQDVGNLLRQSLRVDRFHPLEGSALEDFVGLPLDQELILRVESEARRVVNRYIAQQAEERRKRSMRNARQRVTADEVVARVVDVGVFRKGDDLVEVRVEIESGSGERVILTNTIEEA